MSYSTDVSAGDTILASQYNNLRKDVINATSAVVMAYMSASQAFSNGINPIQFNAIKADTSNQFNASTYTFTAERAGHYYVDCNVGITDSVDTDYYTLSANNSINILLSSGAIRAYTRQVNDGFYIRLSGLVYRAANSTIAMYLSGFRYPFNVYGSENLWPANYLHIFYVSA